MWTAAIVALAFSAGDGDVKVLKLQPLAPGSSKQLLEERRIAPKALHVLRAHLGPDGRMVVDCELDHEHVHDMRAILEQGARQQ